MEVLETKKSPEKTFSESIVTISNQKHLTITGVEKVYESTPKNFQAKVSGTNIIIEGCELNIAKLDVESGIAELEGQIDQIRYSTQKQNYFKKFFK